MTSIIRIVDGQLQISPDGAARPTLSVPVEDWRALNRAVENLIEDTYVSYDDAASRLGVHRSTLTDWIAQGKLQRVLIEGRGYVTATSLLTVAAQRPGSRRPTASTLGLAPLRPAAQHFPRSASGLSNAAEALVRVLTDGDNAIEPHRFPVDPVQAARPGLYSWWGDDEACAVLGEELGTRLPALLYVGQAGATRWPSGANSAATLATRIGTQHIRGNARSSTFRLTVSSLLIEPLSLVPTGGGKLEPASNARASAWIADHLRVAIAPFNDRDTLGRVENEVVVHLDPPLNLEHCPPSAARARITKLRSALGR